MALNAMFHLEIAGTAVDTLFDEDRTQNSVGDYTCGDGDIECYEFSVGVSTMSEGTHGAVRQASHRHWENASMRLPLGKSTAMIFQAVRLNKTVAGIVHFFRVNAETGETIQDFQWTFARGRIVEARIVMPDCQMPETASLDPHLLIKVAAHTHSVISVSGGNEDSDDWTQSSTG